MRWANLLTAVMLVLWGWIGFLSLNALRLYADSMSIGEIGEIAVPVLVVLIALITCGIRYQLRHIHGAILGVCLVLSVWLWPVMFIVVTGGV